VWVIYNNGDFNIIRMMHLLTHDGDEVFNKFRNPDFAAYARVCGALGYRVSQLEDFEQAFAEALKSKRPAVIDALVDPDVFPPFVAWDKEHGSQTLAELQEAGAKS
jgi:acetolactate synthase-1/2/3 large subunit